MILNQQPLAEDLVPQRLTEDLLRIYSLGNI